MDPKTQLVVEATGCEEKEAELVLGAVGGDVARAVKMITLVRKSIAVCKVRFEGRRTVRVTGLVMVVSDMEKGELRHISAVAGYRLQLEPDVSVKMDWRVFGQTVDHLLERSEANRSLSVNLLQHFVSVLQPWKVNEQAALIKSGEFTPLCDFFTQQINSCLDEDVNVDVHVETLTRIQYGEEGVVEEEEARESAGASAEEIGGVPQTIALKTELVIAPIDGKTVRELAEGELVVAKITDETAIGRYLGTLLGAKRDGQDVPIAVPLMGLRELGSGRYRVALQFGPGVVGHAVIDESVRVKVADRPAAVAERTGTDSLLFLILGGAGVLLLVLLILWLRR